MTRNYGFVEPQIADDNYVFGSFLSLPKEVLQSSGNWADYLPLYEPQADKYETYGCTAWGTLNAIETILKRVEGVEYNFSDRFIYNVVGIEPPGEDPHKVSEAVRKIGLIEQLRLPMPDTLAEFKTPRPMTKELINEAHKVLEKYDIGHEWVFTNLSDKTERLKRMKECLRYSPLGVSVTAWKQNDKGEYYSDGPNTHWCLAFRIDEQDRVWVFDSYDHSIKTLSADHDIRFAKRYHITTLKAVAEKLSWMSIILQAIKSILSFMTTKEPTPTEVIEDVPTEPTFKDKLMAAVKDSLGQEVTPKDDIPDEVACAEVVSSIIKKVDPDFPILPSTRDLDMKFYLDKHFKRITEPEEGAVVISPRTAKVFGHVGFFLDKDSIASNTSKTGIFEKNHTWNGWIREYKERRGLRIYLYRPVDNYA